MISPREKSPPNLGYKWRPAANHLLRPYHRALAADDSRGNPDATSGKSLGIKKKPKRSAKHSRRDVDLSSLDGVKNIEVVLRIVPNQFVANGEARYRIYENGVAAYAGSITYFGGCDFLGGLLGLTQEFSGGFRALPETITSSFWQGNGITHHDYRADFSLLADRAAATQIAFSAPSQNDGKGFVTVSRARDIIEIESAEVEGKVFGIPVSFTVVKDQSASVVPAIGTAIRGQCRAPKRLPSAIGPVSAPAQAVAPS